MYVISDVKLFVTYGLGYMGVYIWENALNFALMEYVCKLYLDTLPSTAPPRFNFAWPHWPDFSVSPVVKEPKIKKASEGLQSCHPAFEWF